MLEIAVTCIGLSPSEFWELGWYEWGLYLMRLRNEQEKEKRDFENQWQMTRELWAAIWRSQGAKVKTTDLIKLSFDEQQKKEQQSPGSVVDRFKKKIEERVKRHGGRTK